MFERLFPLVFLLFLGCSEESVEEPPLTVKAINTQDMLTPAYYNSSEGDAFRLEVDNFIEYVRKEQFHHPLKDTSGQMPEYSTPNMGSFGAGKGLNNASQHHPATDMHVGNRETDVTIYAAHDGLVATYKDADKYRQYVSVTKNIKDDKGEQIGKLVTIYAHVDLDLDEGESLFAGGKQVSKGDILSTHLYSGTVGGPHLHFEIRYYRIDDIGDETFYGGQMPGGNTDLTDPSAGKWSYGYWNPNVGYGYGHMKSHGL